jgi:hypothetical protein
MIRALRFRSLIGGLMLASACGTGSGESTVAGPPAPPLPAGEPVTYLFSGPLDHPVTGVTTRSQYLLYGNGAFALRYDTSPRVYLGIYRKDDARITFWFDGSWTLDEGTATGTVKDGLLEIRYSDTMQQSDFRNAVYRRLP